MGGGGWARSAGGGRGLGVSLGDGSVERGGLEVGQIDLHPVERGGVVVGLNEVLADLRAQDFEDVAHPPEDREVAEDGVAGLVHVSESEQPVHSDDAGNYQRFLACA